MFRWKNDAVCDRSMFRGAVMALLALAALWSPAAHAGVGVDQVSTISGLDENGFLIPGTTELTYTMTVTISDVAGGNNLSSLGIIQGLPDGWTYNGSLVTTAPFPPIIPSIGDTEVNVAWITPPTSSFTIGWKLALPANEVGPVDVVSNLKYRLNAGDIPVIRTNTIEVAPTSITVSRQISGTGVGGSLNQFYIPGGTINVSLVFTKAGALTPTALELNEVVTNGLTISNIGGTAIPQVKPADGATGNLDFEWTVVPSFPFTLTYALLIPGGQADPISLNGNATYTLPTGTFDAGVPIKTLTEQPCVSFTRTVVGDGCYIPNRNVTIELTYNESCSTDITAFAPQEIIPAGWRFVSAEGLPIDATAPSPGFGSPLDFIFFTPPTFPFTFRYTVSVPQSETVDPAVISGAALYRLGLANESSATESVSTNVPYFTNCADTVKPVLTLLGGTDINVECGQVFTDPGATALDDRDGDITALVQRTGVVTTTTPGVYTLTYNVFDGANNAADPVSRTVTVVDSAKPNLTLLGTATVTIQCGTGGFTDPGASATDACDGIISNRVVTQGTVNPNSPGTYTLTYNVSDTVGNAANPVTRTVQVIDTTPPLLTLIGAAQLQIACKGTYTESGASATDNCDGPIASNRVVITGTVNTSSPGRYTVTYNVTDTAGNAANAITRTVIVTDTVAPVVTLIGSTPLTVACGSTFTDPGATAVDACQGTLPGTSITPTGAVDTVDPRHL
jgi:hypothetical protein